jgi:SAM-dependent methyltransferase
LAVECVQGLVSEEACRAKRLETGEIRVAPRSVSSWFKATAGEAIERAPASVRRFAARAARFLERHAEDDEPRALVSSREPDVDAAFPDPPVPVPPSVGLNELRAMLDSFSIDGSTEGELQPYVAEAFWRFLRTWDLVRDDHGAALELGANPYFITLLLERYTDLDVTKANYFGAERGVTKHQELRFIDPVAGRVTQDQRSYLFNIEEDPFPFPDETFDVVLFCEIIEHLLMNPLAVLLEIRRVLKGGGHLVVTTPNVNRLDNIVRMISGHNIYDPYSGFGPYGRHNREYTQNELTMLLEFAGFDVRESFTANAHPPEVDQVLPADLSRSLLPSRALGLGQYIFVRATASRPPSRGLPRFLFRSYPEPELADYPRTSV